MITKVTKTDTKLVAVQSAVTEENYLVNFVHNYGCFRVNEFLH